MRADPRSTALHFWWSGDRPNGRKPFVRAALRAVRAGGGRRRVGGAGAGGGDAHPFFSRFTTGHCIFLADPCYAPAGRARRDAPERARGRAQTYIYIYIYMVGSTEYRTPTTHPKAPVPQTTPPLLGCRNVVWGAAAPARERTARVERASRACRTGYWSPMRRRFNPQRQPPPQTREPSLRPYWAPRRCQFALP